MYLEQIGADSRVWALFRPHAGEGIELGRVSFAAHEQYRVLLEGGECEGAPSGRLRWDGTLPAVGDWIAARRVDRDLALIEAVLARRTKFSRRAAGKDAVEQVMAANVDLALVVCGLDGDFNLRRLERYMVLAADSGAETVLVLNKLDLGGEAQARVSQAQAIAGSVSMVAMAALAGVEPLQEIVHGRTVVLLGSSGAGKSTIANGLVGEDRLATRPVREADSRGRHTTTARMLLALPAGGAIIDTPGLRELQLWAGAESLEEVFDEVAALASQCRFKDCTHGAEPGCAVREALERGALDESRWQSYQKLAAEVRYRETEQDLRAKLAQKREWKSIHKSLRFHPKYRR